MKGTGCQRKALNYLFVLTDPYIDYSKPFDVLECTEECANMKACQCSACACCSGCSDLCQCQFSSQVNNRVMENILGFGDELYRYSFDCDISFSSFFSRTAEGYVRDNASDYSDEDELSDDSCGDIDLFDVE